MKTMRVALTTMLLAVLTCAPATANDKCIPHVDISGATGPGVEAIPAVLCAVPGMILIETAEVKDSLFAPNGKSMFVVYGDEISSGEMTDEELYRTSAKLIDVEFRAGSIPAFSNAKLRDKIEEYMAETYLALYGQSVPLIRVRVSALFPMDDGSQSVIYGTEIRNDDGLFGPGFMPETWTVWQLHSSLKK